MKTRLNVNLEIAIVLELKTPHNFTKYTTLLIFNRVQVVSIKCHVIVPVPVF